MAEPLRSGYITKCGKSYKSWKKRWFVLKPNGFLYYYTDPGCKTEKGHIDIINSNKVAMWREVSTAEKLPNIEQQYTTFAVVVSDRTFTCVCDTEVECSDWLVQLNKIANNSEPQHYPAPTHPKEPVAPPSYQQTAPSVPQYGHPPHTPLAAAQPAGLKVNLNVNLQVDLPQPTPYSPQVPMPQPTPYSPQVPMPQPTPYSPQTPPYTAQPVAQRPHSAGYYPPQQPMPAQSGYQQPMPQQQQPMPAQPGYQQPMPQPGYQQPQPYYPQGPPRPSYQQPPQPQRTASMPYATGYGYPVAAAPGPSYPPRPVHPAYAQQPGRPAYAQQPGRPAYPQQPGRPAYQQQPSQPYYPPSQGQRPPVMPYQSRAYVPQPHPQPARVTQQSSTTTVVILR